MQISKRLLVFGLLLLAGGIALGQNGGDLMPTGKGIGTMYRPGQPGDVFGPPRRAIPSGHNDERNGISYHFGPVMQAGKNVYYIWYGNWAQNTATTILPDLITSIGGSPYFNINTTYVTDANLFPNNVVTLSGQAFDNYSHGTSLSDASILQIVTAQAPTDENGVYFVLTSADVNETSGFCTAYCGWHNHASVGGKDIKYGFIGNPARCPTACAAQTTSPNGNLGADGMASIIAHELEEATTDPDLNAWYDNRGAENADKCAWTFGRTYTTANGALANMKLGNRDFLIQQNWVNINGGFCALSH